MNKNISPNLYEVLKSTQVLFKPVCTPEHFIYALQEYTRIKNLKISNLEVENFFNKRPVDHNFRSSSYEVFKLENSFLLHYAPEKAIYPAKYKVKF